MCYFFVLIIFWHHCDLLHTEQMHRNIKDNFTWVKATWVESGDFRQLWATSGNLTHPHRTNKTKYFWQPLRSTIQTLSYARSRIRAQQIDENCKLLRSQDLQMRFWSESKIWAKILLIPRPIPPLCKVRIENQQKDNKNLSKGRVLRDVEDLHGLLIWTSLSSPFGSQD